MRILLTADPEIPVPPVLYGGIERIIDMIIREYHAVGHEVFLVAHRESQTPATLIPYPGTSPRRLSDTVQNLLTVRKALAVRPDVIHSFGRLAYLLAALPARIPKIMSYQREPTARTVRQAMMVARKGTLSFTGCSDYITRQIQPFAPAATVYNGVPTDRYQFNAAIAPDAPLVFLGRLEPVKGPHLAIELAKRTNRRLILAGNIPDEHRAWVESEVLSQVDGAHISYIGPVNDTQKNDLLSQAAAFLMMIDWNEPFGIVMAEALACGTPVIGLAKGSVPEVVLHGKTGFVCPDMESAIRSVEQLPSLSREACRQDAENRFSQQVIAQAYLKLYREKIG